MRTEDLGSVLSVFKSGKLRARIGRQIRRPLHSLQRIIVVFIVGRRRRKDRPLGMIRNKVDALHIRGTGEQYQSFYIGMAFCQIDGIADAAASAAESDSCSIDAGLGNQKLIGCLKVIRPLLIQLLPDLRRPSLEARASTLTKAAVINGERI